MSNSREKNSELQQSIKEHICIFADCHDGPFAWLCAYHDQLQAPSSAEAPVIQLVTLSLVRRAESTFQLRWQKQVPFTQRRGKATKCHSAGQMSCAEEYTEMMACNAFTWFWTRVTSILTNHLPQIVSRQVTECVECQKGQLPLSVMFSHNKLSGLGHCLRNI